MGEEREQLHQHQFGVERAGGFHRFQNVDELARADAQRIEAFNQIGKGDILVDFRDALFRIGLDRMIPASER